MVEALLPSTMKPGREESQSLSGKNEQGDDELNGFLLEGDIY